MGNSDEVCKDYGHVRINLYSQFVKVFIRLPRLIPGINTNSTLTYTLTRRDTFQSLFNYFGLQFPPTEKRIDIVDPPPNVDLTDIAVTGMSPNSVGLRPRAKVTDLLFSLVSSVRRQWNGL